jgi:monothiol glutaredoxin
MSQQDALEKIKHDIESNDICLFMKGTPQAPQCGFSAQVVQILNSYGVPYHAVNVLEDWDLREGIKAYQGWPTIPQLFVKGNFVGGADITATLHRKGELAGILKPS